MEGTRTLITLGVRRVASIVLRHPRSTAAKRLASIGSWRGGSKGFGGNVKLALS